MTDVAIRAEGLGKQYRIGQRERYKALRDTLTDALYAPFRRVASLFGSGQTSRDGSVAGDTIWSLKDVSFEVAQGEVVGIIGRNGAGKSTLLKILSRITEPTTGTAEIVGRVGSLLEVGTGFHPELTGRENVYLNGAILGMRRVEIDRQFDNIVSFAGVEKFIDTPVKHFSSGMHVRLAFAVASSQRSCWWTKYSPSETLNFSRNASARCRVCLERAGPCCSSVTTWLRSASCATVPSC